MSVSNSVVMTSYMVDQRRGVLVGRLGVSGNATGGLASMKIQEPLDKLTPFRVMRMHRFVAYRSALPGAEEVGYLDVGKKMFLTEDLFRTNVAVSPDVGENVPDIHLYPTNRTDLVFALRELGVWEQMVGEAPLQWEIQVQMPNTDTINWTMQCVLEFYLKK